VVGECPACGETATLQQYHDLGYYCAPCVEYMDNEVFAYKPEDE